MQWEIIPRQVEQCCPDLPNFLQEAANAGHETQTLVTKTQALLQAHSRAIANFNRDGDYRWVSVAVHIERTSPHLAGMRESLVEFVKTKAGGSPPIFLNEIDRWTKLLSQVVDIPAAVRSALGKANLASCPEYITAVVKALLASPDGFVQKMKVSLSIPQTSAAWRQLQIES